MPQLTKTLTEIMTVQELIGAHVFLKANLQQMGSVSHCHAGMIVLSQLPSTSGFSGAGWLRVFQKIRQLKVKTQLINVNLKHAMFKFYTLTESYCPKSMPRCLTAAFYLFIYFYLPHKRNYCEPTYTVIKKKSSLYATDVKFTC